MISAEFFLLSGVGTFVGIWTQSWLWAVGTVAILFLLAYLLGYHKALTLFPLSATAVVSGMLAYGITLLLTSTHYDQAQTSLLWFNTLRVLTLRHQLIAGTCIGAVFSLWGGSAVIATLRGDVFSASSFESAFYSGGISFGIGGGFIVWFIVSSLGSIFNWGFGFGFGWNFNLFCGFLVTAIAGIGMVCLFYIYIRARSIRYDPSLKINQ